MTTRVLLLGGTGRTGGRVLARLLGGGVPVRALVRSASRLPAGTAGLAGLEVVEAELASLSQGERLDLVRGCGAIVSCLGHKPDLRGVFGQPRDLINHATEILCRAVAESRPPAPVKFILMSSVLVNRPGRADSRRGTPERALLGLMRALVPPARDHQRAADFLVREIGPADTFLRWVVVRPDSLVDGEVSRYELEEGIVSGLAKPDRTAMANVAHFICELVAEPRAWGSWEGRMPVIVDAPSMKRARTPMERSES